MRLGHRRQPGEYLAALSCTLYENNMLRLSLMCCPQAKAEWHVRKAAAQGAQIILLQELFGERIVRKVTEAHGRGPL